MPSPFISVITSQRSKRKITPDLRLMRPCPQVSRYFWKRRLLPPFSKKYASTRSAFGSFSPVHTKTLRQWKHNSIPSRACAVSRMILSYWIGKPPFSSYLAGVFKKSCFFGARYAVYVRRGPETKGLTKRWQSQRLLFTLFTSCFTNERWKLVWLRVFTVTFGALALLKCA